jgi:hypothetical protein
MKKSRPALKDLSEAQRQFVESGKAVAEPEPDPAPEKSVALFLRVSPALSARLKRASLQRQLDGKAPWQIKDITAQALERWLNAEEKKSASG